MKTALIFALLLLKALGSGAPQGALNRSDIPPVDLSALVAEPRDGGRSGRELRVGQGGGGSLSGIGARDH